MSTQLARSFRGLCFSNTDRGRVAAPRDRGLRLALLRREPVREVVEVPSTARPTATSGSLHRAAWWRGVV